MSKRLTYSKTTVNLSPKSIDPTFGQSGADASVWSKIASLISSVRMVVRCTFGAPEFHLPLLRLPHPRPVDGGRVGARPVHET